MKVQLLTFAGCPNSGVAREMLRSVLASTGITASIEEVDTTAPETPDVLRGWGSPTILIDGADVEGQQPGGPSCRIYRDEDGRLRGSPSEALEERVTSGTNLPKRLSTRRSPWPCGNADPG